MKIQVNSDSTIDVHAGLTNFVEDEVGRALKRFAVRLTRVEVHLCDVDNKKTGHADKRCLIEARPAGARPLSASARANQISFAVDEALGKMQRSLTTFFGRKGRFAVAAPAPVPTAKKAAAKKAVAKKATPKKTTVKKTAEKKTTPAAKKKASIETPTKLSSRGPKKKKIYQARRKPWPVR